MIAAANQNGAAPAPWQQLADSIAGEVALRLETALARLEQRLERALSQAQPEAGVQSDAEQPDLKQAAAVQRLGTPGGGSRTPTSSVDLEQHFELKLPLAERPGHSLPELKQVAAGQKLATPNPDRFGRTATSLDPKVRHHHGLRGWSQTELPNTQSAECVTRSVEMQVIAERPRAGTADDRPRTSLSSLEKTTQSNQILIPFVERSFEVTHSELSELSRPESWEPKERSCLLRAVESSCFNTISMSVIIVNTIFVVVRTDLEARYLADAPNLGLFDLFFTFVYSLECGLKLCAYGKRFWWDPREKYWNVFDLVLVIVALLDLLLSATNATQILRGLRIFKIVRTFRVFRVLKFMRELRTMITVVVKSIKTLFWSICMLVFVLLIFGLIFIQNMTQFRIENEAHRHNPDIVKYFGSVGATMTGLFQSNTGGVDWGELYDLVAMWGPITGLLFQSFIVCFQMAVFNVITSIYVDKARKLGQADDDDAIEEKMNDEKDQRESLRRLFTKLDTDRSGEIDLEELKENLKDPEVVQYFDHHGLRIRDVKLFFKTLGTTGNYSSVPLEAFVDGCVKLQGDATSLDVQVLRLHMQANHSILHKLATKLDVPLGSFVKTHANTSMVGARSSMLPEPRSFAV